MKKFLATMLALVMALTLCSTAWAEGTTATVSDWDTLKTAFNDSTITTIDLNGGTYSFKDAVENECFPIKGKTITFTNGIFDFSGTVVDSKDCLFHIDENSTVTFNGVNFIGTDYTSVFGVIHACGSSTVYLNNCSFNLTGEQHNYGGVLKGTDATGCKFIVSNCEFDLTNTYRVFANITLEMSDTEINSKIVNGGTPDNAFRNVYGTITGSTITFNFHEHGIKNTDNKALTISNSAVTLSNSTKDDVYLNAEDTIKTDVTTKLSYATLAGYESATFVTLTLVLDDETTTMIPVASGSKINLVDYTPAKTGYTFGTWDDVNAGQTYSGEIELNSNLTLKATWNNNVYNINYELDGGTNVAANPDKYTYGTGVASFAAPTKAGFNFNGWVDGNGNAVTTIAKDATGDVTLYAQWTAEPHRVIKNVTTDTTETKAESPKTFDAGVVVYGLMAVSSVLGMGVVSKKKF